MKINPMGTSRINPYTKQMNKIDQSLKSVQKASDKIEISSVAKDMQVAAQGQIERKEKVAELKNQFQTGNYNVNPQEVAEGLLKFYRG